MTTTSSTTAAGAGAGAATATVTLPYRLKHKSSLNLTRRQRKPRGTQYLEDEFESMTASHQPPPTSGSSGGGGAVVASRSSQRSFGSVRSRDKSPTRRSINKAQTNNDNSRSSNNKKRMSRKLANLKRTSTRLLHLRGIHGSSKQSKALRIGASDSGDVGTAILPGTTATTNPTNSKSLPCLPVEERIELVALMDRKGQPFIRILMSKTNGRKKTPQRQPGQPAQQQRQQQQQQQSAQEHQQDLEKLPSPPPPFYQDEEKEEEEVEKTVVRTAKEEPTEIQTSEEQEQSQATTKETPEPTVASSSVVGAAAVAVVGTAAATAATTAAAAAAVAAGSSTSRESTATKPDVASRAIGATSSTTGTTSTALTSCTTQRYTPRSTLVAALKKLRRNKQQTPVGLSVNNVGSVEVEQQTLPSSLSNSITKTPPAFKRKLFAKVRRSMLKKKVMDSSNEQYMDTAAPATDNGTITNVDSIVKYATLKRTYVPTTRDHDGDDNWLSDSSPSSKEEKDGTFQPFDDQYTLHGNGDDDSDPTSDDDSSQRSNSIVGNHRGGGGGSSGGGGGGSSGGTVIAAPKAKALHVSDDQILKASSTWSSAFGWDDSDTNKGGTKEAHDERNVRMGDIDDGDDDGDDDDDDDSDGNFDDEGDVATLESASSSYDQEDLDGFTLGSSSSGETLFDEETEMKMQMHDRLFGSLDKSFDETFDLDDREEDQTDEGDFTDGDYTDEESAAWGSVSCVFELPSESREAADEQSQVRKSHANSGRTNQKTGEKLNDLAPILKRLSKSRDNDNGKKKEEVDHALAMFRDHAHRLGINERELFQALEDAGELNLQNNSMLSEEFIRPSSSKDIPSKPKSRWQGTLRNSFSRG